MSSSAGGLHEKRTKADTGLHLKWMSALLIPHPGGTLPAYMQAGRVNSLTDRELYD